MGSEMCIRDSPEGMHVAQARKTIKAVESAYYQDVTSALGQCEKNKDWNQCIQLSNRYIDIYRDSSNALKLKQRRDKYQINLQNDTILAALTAKAGGATGDPVQIRSVFERFIRESPNSPAVPIVRSELAKINKNIGRQEAQQELGRLQDLFAKKGGRFTIRKKETFHDSKTGLTWTLLDSRLLTGHCMTYDEARQNIKTMKLGGYTDWRLPNAKELMGLYRPPTSFQGAASDWYWSSDSFKRYSGEWIILVDVVNPAPRPTTLKQNSNMCGWFRAVRP